MKRQAILLLVALATACNSGETITTTVVQEPVARILEYTPAPGQFINSTGAGFTDVNSAETACAYAAQRFASGDYVTLGGWGGYLIAAFAEPVPAAADYELYIQGNAEPFSSEPGVVWVSQDTNTNGIADDAWYELRGSEYDRSTHHYRITYQQPDASGQIAWTDNQGGSGSIDRNTYHNQSSYFPAWLGTQPLTFEGTLLPNNLSQTEIQGSQAWTPLPFAWGYADNSSSIDGRDKLNRFRIADAVAADGAAAHLTQIDFIKVQTGVNGKAPEIGELSTEIYTIGCFRMRQSN